MKNRAWKSSIAFCGALAIGLGAAGGFPRHVDAQPRPRSERSSSEIGPSEIGPASDEAVEGINGLIQYVIIKNLPTEYEDTSKWGGTKEIWAGLEISRDGLNIEARKRKKKVNHGSWERYRVWPTDPENALQVRVENSRTVPGKGMGFDLVVVARLGAAGRRSEWQRGVQLFSLSAEAEAVVRLQLNCVVGMTFDLRSFPIAVCLEPVVEDARLDLIEFRLNRISKLNGPLVHELGRALRDVLRREVDRKSEKLLQRINDQIEKNHDELRFSLDGVLPGLDEAWQDLGQSSE